MAERQSGKVLQNGRGPVELQKTKEQSDGALLRAFCAGDDQMAFAALVKRHGRLVLATCRRILHGDQDAEDAFQATFIFLARSAAALPQQESLAGWLHAVARRMAANARRAAERRRRHERQAKTMEPTNPAWEAAWREVQLLLDDEIQSLPEKYREPFILCCLENHSCAEAAGRLGLKEGTVWSRLAEARKQLATRLGKRGVVLSAVLGAAALTPGRIAARVPPSLATATVRASSSAAFGESSAGAFASPRVAALVAGMSRAAVMAKIKLGAALFAAAVVIVMGWGAMLGRPLAADGSGRPHGSDSAARPSQCAHQ